MIPRALFYEIIMKVQFDIKYRPQIESGEYKVETNAGDSVRIVCWDAKRKYGDCICGFMGEEEDRPYFWQPNGCWWADHTQSPFDLFIVTPEPELTDWEGFISGCLQKHGLLDCGAADRIAKECSAELLELAREELVKQGYVIEKKAFHDAVEKIDDRHKAEMCVEYSLHCKIENGTRHAVMNWNEFQKVAQHFIDCGKAEALKDLPRWKKWGNGAGGNGQGIPMTSKNSLALRRTNQWM